MTLLKRNYFFKVEIFMAALILAGLIFTAFTLIPVYPSLISEISRRPWGIVQSIAARFLEPAAYVPFVSIAGAVVYSLVSLILIYYFFETTNAREILFVAIFALSLAFEGLRLLFPLKMAYNFPNVYLVMGFRMLLFARYGGIFSLFAASVCAAGLEVQKQRNIIMVIVIAALMIAVGLPIDALTWDSSLSMISGYAATFRMVEMGIGLITVISFLISAYSRGSREYFFVGIGSFLALLGRHILLSADTWFSPLPGLLVLALGTWFICIHLHRIYLWL